LQDKKDAPTTIDAYIAQFSPEIQQILTRLRAVIHEAAPEATEKISYQMPTFYLNGNLVHFAVHARHIGVYPGGSELKGLGEDISAYRTSKGTLQFPLDQPIPYDLIRKITQVRAAENLSKPRRKS
jgi:uncharacterized protein YdhG (YjbR/CyaY superfamily)